MSAQPGSACLLDQVAQPAAAQLASACLLDQTIASAGRVSSRCVAPWAPAQPLAHRLQARTAAVVTRDGAHRMPWGVAAHHQARTRVPWGVAAQADRRVVAPWGAFSALRTRRLPVVWGVAAQADRHLMAPWGVYARTPAVGAAPAWGQYHTHDLAAVLPWVPRVAMDLPAVLPWGLSRASNPRWVLPWVRYSRPLNPGWGVVTPPNEPPTNEDGTIVVPSLRSYIVLNNVTLVRVSNSQPISALSLQISIDANSWGWGWSASVPALHLSALLPSGPGAPVELEAQVNGVVWRLLAERLARDRRLGQDRIAVSGRGIAAELSAPLYPVESRDNIAGALTSQQLADAALTVNGVPLGWTLDWQIADWLVPAGAWVHTGTPMEAVARIAAAAGGYVQADPMVKTLHILPRYPVLPWAFAAATPDYILPSAATTREATDYVEKPDYNVVYVAGGALGGVLGQVKKTGTAGDLPAEMVVDPLVTHVDAARGRGEQVLGDTGPQQILTLETPVLEAVGIYPVGALIEWQEGVATRRGLVRSVSISAALPRVRQTIEVECHG